MAEIISFRDDPHQRTEMLLPWYVSGRADPADAELVETHIAACAHCRTALARERLLKAAIEDMPISADLGWQKLERRIAPDRPLRPRRRPIWSMNWPVALAAFAAMQLALLTSVVLLFRPADAPAPYQTLGASAPPIYGNMIVLFRPDATEQELRYTLDRAGARLVDGPTAAGAYVLTVDPARRDAALAALRARPSVLLAQPIERGIPR